jgi:hypothetical protein
MFSSPLRASKKTAILRRFLPLPPESLKGNPLNSEGFRDVEFAGKEHLPPF